MLKPRAVKAKAGYACRVISAKGLAMRCTKSVCRAMLLLSLSSTLVLPPSYASSPDSKGKLTHAGKAQKKDWHEVGNEDAVELNLARADISAETARGYVRELQIDRSGYAALPPGIRKSLVRGKPLPPDIGKKAVPNRLKVRLPVHDGYTWQVVGTDLVLISATTGIVADVLQDVFGGN